MMADEKTIKISPAEKERLNRQHRHGLKIHAQKREQKIILQQLKKAQKDNVEDVVENP